MKNELLKKKKKAQAKRKKGKKKYVGFAPSGICGVFIGTLWNNSIHSSFVGECPKLCGLRFRTRGWLRNFCRNKFDDMRMKLDGHIKGRGKGTMCELAFPELLGLGLMCEGNQFDNEISLREAERRPGLFAVT